MVSIQNLVQMPLFNDNCEMTENQSIAKEVVQRFPAAEYGPDAPIYKDLAKVYQDLKKSAQKINLSSAIQTLSKYKIPTTHLKSLTHCRELVGEILKTYGLQKANDYLADRFPF